MCAAQFFESCQRARHGEFAPDVLEHDDRDDRERAKENVGHEPDGQRHEQHEENGHLQCVDDHGAHADHEHGETHQQSLERTRREDTAMIFRMPVLNARARSISPLR